VKEKKKAKRTKVRLKSFNKPARTRDEGASHNVEVGWWW